MPDLQSSDMRHIRQMMSALSLASARLSKLGIPFVNHLLDEDFCKNFFDFDIFFWFSIMIFVRVAA